MKTNIKEKQYEVVQRSIKELMGLFPYSFINSKSELILIPKTNLYFLLKDVKTLTDLYFKVISYCSRDACKTTPYRSDWHNLRYQSQVRNSINTFLNVEFTKEQWMDIYTYYGNAYNQNSCYEFINNNFDLEIIRKLQENKNER
ncbi:hypothetical protein [uncultured Clostridium sp.]|uniref:hypothetical protein n=1 Tax=uncultured Clostridium sp. TaxID=59620 RepID=UPI00262F8FE7|nr:hypothetical protein [uncultured Clostridium sp.]